MDRFIAKLLKKEVFVFTDLKSNMDRFIAIHAEHAERDIINLKSNMDRFIVNISKSDRS